MFKPSEIIFWSVITVGLLVMVGTATAKAGGATNVPPPVIPIPVDKPCGCPCHNHKG